MRPLAAPAALLLAFALGLGAQALWQPRAGPAAEITAGGQVELQPGSGARQTANTGVLLLRLDADAAGFAARASASRRKTP